MRHLFLLLSFSLLSSSGSLPACGYYILGEEYRIALFNPYLIGEDYSAFFYSTEYLNHRINAQAGPDRRRNAAAWAKELSRGRRAKKVTAQDVLPLLYGTSLADWVNAKEGGAQNLGWHTNPAWLNLRERPDVLEYMLYAKGYESPAEPAYEWWQEQEEVPVVPALAPYKKAFEQRALTGYQKAKKGKFLKERYAYQLLLLAYYANDEEAMETYFMQHFHQKEGPLADWARFHFSGQWNEEGRELVELANAFRAVPEKALAVYHRTARQLDPKQYLQVAKTDEERSNVYALAALKRKGKALNYLQEAYRLDPSNPIVKLLLVRELNKLEDWLMTYELTGLGPAIPSASWPDWSEDYEQRKQAIRAEAYQQDRAYLKQFRTFLDDYQPRRTDAAFAQVLKAQTALLDEDFDAARQLTANISADDSELGRQVSIINYLALLQGSDLQQATVRNDLAKALLALDTLLNQDRGPEEYYDPKKHKLKPSLSRVTARAFEQAGDTVRAFFLHNRSLELALGDWYRSDYYEKIEYLDRPLSPSILDEVIALVRKNDTSTPFGQLLLAAELPEMEALHDLAGTLALRRNDLEEALTYFEQVPLSWYYDNEYFQSFHYNYYRQEGRLWANPFAAIVGFSTQLPTISKREIVRRMIAREADAQKGGNVGAQACLILAEAWYNMSDFGPAWDLLSYGRSTYAPKGPIAWPNGYNHAGVPHSQHDFELIHYASRAQEYLECAAAAGATEPGILAEVDLYQRILEYRQLEKKAIQESYGWLRPEERTELGKAYDRLLTPFVRQYGDSDYYWRAVMQCSKLGAVGQ